MSFGDWKSMGRPFGVPCQFGMLAFSLSLSCACPAAGVYPKMLFKCPDSFHFHVTCLYNIVRKPSPFLGPFCLRYSCRRSGGCCTVFATKFLSI